MTESSRSTATILDVARRAGVSRTTVSRVLNEPDRVTASTLAKVRTAAAELHYSPNSVARSLRSGRTGLVALLVGDISQPFHSALAQSVATAAETQGFSVILYDLAHSTTRLEGVLGRLPQQGVDGVILATADDVSTPEVQAALHDCLDHGIAVVTGVQQSGLAEVVAVDTDHRLASTIATRTLASEGFTSPALLVGDLVSPLARSLVEGSPSATVIDIGYSFEEAESGVGALPPHVDSLIIATLPMALGAMSGLARAARPLPVIICEDVPLAHQIRPSFATCAVEPRATGDEMVRLIEAAINGGQIDRRSLTPQLRRGDTF